MRDHGPSSLGLAGSILIAHPSLLDPNFKRGIVFISAHASDEGAFGLVLNRPTGKTIAQFLPEESLGALARVPVFFGGPVAGDQLTIASFRWDEKSETVECKTHIALEDAWQLLNDGETVVRGFIGYSGWSAGQLEAELGQQSWLVQKPDEAVVSPERCLQLWQAIMSEQGPWFKLLAGAPDDPSLN